METLQLENNKSTAITFEQLGKSTMENSYDVPNSYEGIKSILGLTQEYSPAANVMNVWVSNSPKTGYAYNTSKYSGDPEKKGLIQHYIFRRLIAEIRLTTPIDGGQLIVAVKYDSNKYTIAIGSNITVCSNMMIMNSYDIIHTGLRGADKLGFDNALDILSNWLVNKENIVDRCNNFIETSKNITLDNSKANMLIGYLSRKSVLPVNKQVIKNYQVTELCKNINKAFEEKDKLSVWDFWNSGTNNLKPDNTDLSTYFDNISNFTRFCDTFTINPQNLITNG